jgi:hypothetical protein
MIMITTIEQVTRWLGNPPVDPELINDAWSAAEGYVSSRTEWPDVDADGKPLAAPSDLIQAVDLLTARYLQRRHSPDGMLGLGELGAIQVAFSDVDVEKALNPWRIIAVA